MGLVCCDRPSSANLSEPLLKGNLRRLPCGQGRCNFECRYCLCSLSSCFWSRHSRADCTVPVTKADNQCQSARHRPVRVCFTSCSTLSNFLFADWSFAIMKTTTPEISWHGRDPIYSVDFQYIKGSIRRLASCGTDRNVRVSVLVLQIPSMEKVPFVPHPIDQFIASLPNSAVSRKKVKNCQPMKSGVTDQT